MICSQRSDDTSIDECFTAQRHYVNNDDGFVARLLYPFIIALELKIISLKFVYIYKLLIKSR